VFCGRNFCQLATLFLTVCFVLERSATKSLTLIIVDLAGVGKTADLWAPVLPTSGNLFRPNQLKNSAADEKIRPLPLFFNKGFFTKTFTSRKLIS
jgi:hypothetical protein